MAYKTKAEKRAWRKGLFAGFKKCKKRASSPQKRKKSRKRATPPPGVYTPFGRINENLVDGLQGPVVFWDGNL